MGRVIGGARTFVRAWDRYVFALVIFGGVACAPGGGGGGGGSTTGGGSANPGDVVGTFELAAPTVDDFILHGTLPVPPLTFPMPGGETPFQVVNHNGGLVPAQVETVTRYARSQQGSDVVEVLARVALPPGTNPGDRVRYNVVYQPRPPAVFRPNASVRALLTRPEGIRVRSHDVFGNEYHANILLDAAQGADSARVLKNGSQAIQTATHETLFPVAPVTGPSGTLPHLMGVHSYFTEWANEPFFSLDLRIHSAHSGEDSANPFDDAMGQMYFDAFEIILPAGWVVLNAFPDPFMGAPITEGQNRAWPIVSQIGGGTMHVLPALGQFHRRLVVAKVGEEPRAVAYLREEGLGFCRAGPSPTGGDLWSWWNKDTARYFPQKHRLPSLDHVNQDVLRQQDDQALGVRAQQVFNGSNGPWPSQETGLGYAHPWGIDQGGMVSGLEIHLYEGIKTLSAASNSGYRFSQLVHRMLTDRQRNVMYNANGLPTRMEEWVVPHPQGALLPVWWFGGPMLWAADPFGVTASPNFQRNAVAGLGRQPPWEGRLLAYQTIDAEHLIRYTRMAKALAWLGNDAIAKDDLRGQAESVRFGYNMYRQDHYPQGVIVTGMYFDRSYADYRPGWGISYGRAEGWGLDTMNAYYSLGDPQWRADVRPWFNQVIDILRDGQTDCTGIIQATPLTNVFNAQYRCRQSIEAAITENAIMGMRESVFRGDDLTKVAQTNQVLEKVLYAMISDYVWDEVGHGPAALFGVGGSSTDLPPFCDYIPTDGTYGYPDHALPWCSLAYGFEVTRDPQFLNRAAEAMNSGNLTAACFAMGANEIENRAALLALVQEL
ncbi:MAG: hypothetical protein ACKVXR_13305 [Planctomycetota bacterium]